MRDPVDVAELDFDKDPEPDYSDKSQYMFDHYGKQERKPHTLTDEQKQDLGSIIKGSK